MERRLYKYVEVDYLDEERMEYLRRQWINAGLDPSYDLWFDVPTDMPYDVYRAGDKPTLQHIMLLSDYQQELVELSKKSDIVRSISGLHRGKHYIYFPMDKVKQVMPVLSKETCHLLKLT